MNKSFQITHSKIDADAMRKDGIDDTCGAVVTFEGLVRNHHDGKAVTALAYESHPIMAEPEGEKILSEVIERFEVTHAIAVHRVGNVPIGEAAVITMVSASHRAEAFSACSYLIEEIKSRVPIWKYETYADGTSLYTEQCAGCASRKGK